MPEPAQPWNPTLLEVANRLAYLHGELNRENPALARKYGPWLRRAYDLIYEQRESDDA